MIIYNQIKYKSLLIAGILSAVNGAGVSDEISKPCVCIQQDSKTPKKALTIVQKQLCNGPAVRDALSTARTKYTADVGLAEEYYCAETKKAKTAFTLEQSRIQKAYALEIRGAQIVYQYALDHHQNAKYDPCCGERYCAEIIAIFPEICKQLMTRFTNAQQASQEALVQNLLQAEEARDASISAAHARVSAIYGINAAIATTSRDFYSAQCN